MNDPSVSTRADVAYQTIKAMVSAVPVVGGPGSVLLDALMGAPLERRRERWFRQVGEAITNLESKVAGFSIESLVGDESFVTILVNATLVALRNHREDKLRALRNAIASSAINRSPDAETELIFLRFVDELTSRHVRLLTLLDDPQRALFPGGGVINLRDGDCVWHSDARRDCHSFPRPRVTHGHSEGADGPLMGLEKAVRIALPDVAELGDIPWLVNDLQARGLCVQGGSNQLHVISRSKWERLSTSHGRKFLRFISEPA